MYRLLALLLAVMLFPIQSASAGTDIDSASADTKCVDLDGAARICPADGVFNLDQNDRFSAGFGVTLPDGEGQVFGIAIEVADGCRFSGFTLTGTKAPCQVGSFEQMKTHWAAAFEAADAKVNGGVGRRKLVEVAPRQIGGHAGYMARYRSDYTGTTYSDIWDTLFITEVNGRHFLFFTVNASNTPNFNRIAQRIEKAISFMEFSGGKRK